jgi:hypothetical protein
MLIFKEPLTSNFKNTNFRINITPANKDFKDLKNISGFKSNSNNITPEKKRKAVLMFGNQNHSKTEQNGMGLEVNVLNLFF